MKTIPTGQLVWQKLHYISPLSEAEYPIFTDKNGRNFVLCQVMLREDGMQDLVSVKISDPGVPL